MVTNNSVAIWDSVGKKQYELDNHLGNVLTTVTDKRLQHSTSGTSIDYFNADVASAQDYYPFGMLQPGRQYTFGSDSTYRYGFNGKENDNTVKGLGNQVYFGSRILDTRIGSWLSTDPLQRKYPEITPYSFAANNPINLVDADGRDIIRFMEVNHYETLHNPRFGYSYRKIISTDHLVTIIKAPGKDKFFSDVVNIDASAHNKPETNSIQFFPQAGSLKRSGATESYIRVFDIPIGIKTNDFDVYSLLRLAPESLLTYLEKHNPKEYGGYAMMQEDIAIRKAVPAALATVVIWGNPLAEGETGNALSDDVETIELKPYGGKGGGHHVLAKAGFKEAPNYSEDQALAIPNEELARLNISHRVITTAQMRGYREFAATGATLTWDAVSSIETKALESAGVGASEAQKAVNEAIGDLKNAGVIGPTRIPWGGN